MTDNAAASHEVPAEARIAIKLQRDKDALALDCTLVTDNEAEFRGYRACG